ncbi:hypothetical protein ES703_100613 [subsurface metagenome]
MELGQRISYIIRRGNKNWNKKGEKMIYVIDSEINAIIEFREDGKSIGTPGSYIENRINYGAKPTHFAVIKGEEVKIK